MSDPCKCDCTSQNGSGWCFPFDLSLIPSDNLEFDEKLDISPSPTDTVDVKVVRSSGSAGVCETFYGSYCVEAYYCVSGEKVTEPNAIPPRTANVGIVLPNDTCVDFSNINMPTGTTYDGKPYVSISGIPMTYFPDNDQLCARWSASICGVSLTGCCDPAVRGFLPGYALCYDVVFYINSDADAPLCESELIAGTNGQGTPRLIQTTHCDRYSWDDENCDKVLTLNPFESSGVDVNTWKISNECIDIQKELPEQSGVYSDGSYIGGFGPTPSGLQPF
ncbi:MAG: hypothetical protein ACTSPB_20570 [Candidatus Thorarchaeota archaeon]